MKYKVNDRVRIKSIDWYNENKDEDGNVDLNYNFTFYADRSKYCGKVFTISEVFNNCYRVKEENNEFNEYCWTDEMIEGLVEEEKSLCEGCCSLELKYNKLTIADNICTDEVEIILQDYELKQRGDKWFAVKKKKEYPKTYEECYQVTGLLKTSDIYGYKNGLLFEFQKLLIARDAYWKIAGEEMGLGKPWEPDWLDDDTRKYIITSSKVFETFGGLGYINYVLTFPTEEMRDAFYENFKSEIESCKELL